jgi:hypothetical protein
VTQQRQALWASCADGMTSCILVLLKGRQSVAQGPWLQETYCHRELNGQNYYRDNRFGNGGGRRG